MTRRSFLALKSISRGRPVSVAALVFAGAVSMAGWATSWAATTPEGPVGIWLDHTQRGAVEIYPCGGSLCGRVIWMKNPIKSSGQPYRDLRNPDASKRKRTICGMKILGRLRQKGRGLWDGGWIYDPERGQSFDLQVKVQGTNRLTVTGYLMSPVFGKSFRWVRAPEDIGRCAPAVEAVLSN